MFSISFFYFFYYLVKDKGPHPPPFLEHFFFFFLGRSVWVGGRSLASRVVVRVAFTGHIKCELISACIFETQPERMHPKKADLNQAKSLIHRQAQRQGARHLKTS